MSFLFYNLTKSRSTRPQQKQTESHSVSVTQEATPLHTLTVRPVYTCEFGTSGEFLEESTMSISIRGLRQSDVKINTYRSSYYFHMTKLNTMTVDIKKVTIKDKRF